MTRSSWLIMVGAAISLAGCGLSASPSPTAPSLPTAQSIPPVTEPTTEALPAAGAGIPTPESVTTAVIEQRLNPFTDSQCALPCYNGLTPGQADMNGALGFFSRLGISPIDMVPGDYDTTLDGTGHMGAALLRATDIEQAVKVGYKPPNAEVAMLSGVVDNVSINWPDYPPYLTLPIVLQQLGPPNQVDVGLRFIATPPLYVLQLIYTGRQTGFIFAGVTREGSGVLDVCPNEETITNMAMGVFSASQAPLAGSEVSSFVLPLEQSTGTTLDAFLTQINAGGCLSITADRWPQWQKP